MQSIYFMKNFCLFFITQGLQLLQMRSLLFNCLYIEPEFLSGTEVWVLTGPVQDLYSNWFSLKQWSVSSAEGSGSLSCRKVDLNLCLRSLVDSNRFPSRTSLCFAPSFFLLWPVPADGNIPTWSPHMMLPLPCLSTGMMFSVRWVPDLVREFNIVSHLTTGPLFLMFVATLLWLKKIPVWRFFYHYYLRVKKQ